VDELLGLLYLAGYIVSIVGLAAAITYAVIKIFPTERTPKKPDAPETEPPASESPDAPAGSLFRRSKRRAT
jgi:hypothetical protein